MLTAIAVLHLLIKPAIAIELLLLFVLIFSCRELHKEHSFSALTFCSLSLFLLSLASLASVCCFYVCINHSIFISISLLDWLFNSVGNVSLDRLHCSYQTLSHLCLFFVSILSSLLQLTLNTLMLCTVSMHCHHTSCIAIDVG